MKIPDDELVSVLPLLYYGTKHFDSNSPHNIHLKTIAQQLKVSSSKLKCILNKLQFDKDIENITKVGRKRKLKQEHLEYLGSSDTLNRWAGYSLKERALFFHRQFPDTKISKTLLWRTYKLFNIKFKVIRQEKLVSKIDPVKIDRLTIEMRQ